MMPCAGAEGFPCHERSSARERLGLPHARLRGTIERHNAFPDDPDAVSAAAGRWTATGSTTRPASGPTTSTCSRPMTIIPVICVFQIEDLGFCGKGEGAGLHPPPYVRDRRHFPVQHLGRPIVGRPGRCRRRHARASSRRSGNSPAQTLGAQVENARHALV